MIISCWNIRGLNQPLKQKEIVSLVKANDIDVLGILESKVRSPNQDKIHQNMLPHWNFVNNSQPKSVDRIWIGWNPNKINLTISKCTNQVIHVHIDNMDQTISLDASFIYGFNSIQDRRSLWNDLRSISASLGDLPWISLGDFNVVLNPFEIFGGKLGRDQGAEEFNALVNSTCLVDLHYTGVFFSWNNRRTDAQQFIKKKTG